MDVLKEKKTGNWILRNKLVMSGILLTLAVFFLFKINADTVPLDEFVIAEVKRGDLNQVVKGYGKLQSSSLQQITASAQATVKEIRLRPGDKVTAGSVIVVLENLELKQNVEAAQRNVDLELAELQQEEVFNARELLDEEDLLAQLMSEYKAIKLRSTAEKELFDKGIVSGLVYKQTKLQETLIKERLEIREQRKAQLIEIHKKRISVKNQKIMERKSRLSILQRQLEDLTVRAEFNGLLQKLPLEVGQSVERGSLVALIGSADDLKATIKIPQNSVQLLENGQAAVIDTRQSIIHGRVFRISPVIEDNTVDVEIELLGDLPENARAQLNVDGSINIATKRNVLYLEKPPSSRQGSSMYLYKIDREDGTLFRIKVDFGIESGNLIELLSNHKLGDEFILSKLNTSENTIKYND
ncbi:efflux RND transporter periplasmic adaptor subunit [Pseudoalteromonas luteoviolacea]|uniref:efflux RND transporter periplasmic adaptor subunit n=1 Tax=Pseudoalteromonas luteoviolacea TaxID=43657 RepID=UPI001F46C059|nr:HlyD family efflux transporter periplasmic adaptor subunit [Pseudoalteromonas luteoviolacea]MCF6442195.1 efflux RND transporter periplasmic adaptor subunit [Pseudoalteromonas luteoviolacea]